MSTHQSASSVSFKSEKNNQKVLCGWMLWNSYLHLLIEIRKVGALFGVGAGEIEKSPIYANNKEWKSPAKKLSISTWGKQNSNNVFKELIYIIVGLCSSTHIKLSIDILRRYLPSNTTAGWPCLIVVSLSNYNSLLLLVFK